MGFGGALDAYLLSNEPGHDGTEYDESCPRCFHCGEEYEGAGYDACGETHCSTQCALECSCMCDREQETPWEWQVMERCAGGSLAYGKKYTGRAS